jgi:beta-lactam-binding protein with PASTA domain
MSASNVIVSAVVAAAVAAGTTYALDRTGLLRETVDVPAVTGLPVESARMLVERSGLLFLIAEERDAPQTQPGQIVTQRPLEGSKLYRGESISVVVAKAPAVVKVPLVVAQPLGEAKLRLEAGRLAVGKVSEEASPDVPAGSVISQSIAADSETKVGAALDLVVSKGADTIAVPKVAGRSLNTAKKELTKAGFTVGKVRYRMNEDHDEGIVLEQTPAADQQAAKGSAVDLVVNTFQ